MTTTPPDDRHFFTPAEVAQILHVSPMSVYRLIESCELTPVVRIRRQFRIHHTALTEYLNRVEVGR